MSKRAVKILVGFILLLPLLALVHEMLIFAIASLVASSSSNDLLYQFVRQFLTSPVHAATMIETLGGIRAEGIIVAGLPGKILSTLAPSVFIDPDTRTIPIWISAIIDKNSTVLGFYATQSIVEFITIVVGALLLQSGLQTRSIRQVLKTAPLFDALRVIAGFFLIAQAIWAAFGLTMSPALAGLRETGIGVGFSLLFQLDQQRYTWMMDESLPVLLPTILILTAIGSAWLLSRFFSRIGLTLGKPVPVAPPSREVRVVRKLELALVLLPFLALSPISQRYFGLAYTTLVTLTHLTALAPQLMETLLVVQPTPTPPATPTALSARVATLTAPPTVRVPSPTATTTPILQRQIELRRIGNKFTFVVNGRPTYLAGINYNVNYTALQADVKRKYHQRDFQLMKNAGINAVIGWGVYDRVTLEVAHEFGIGVIMPFELDAKGAYESNRYREQIKNEFRKYILEHKDALAVWGWNPGGDELLQRMETEYHRTPDKLQLASDFLLELATLAYSLDPNRVSFIKEPRDWYVPYIEESIRRVRVKTPAFDPSKYFVFAVNTYGKPEGVSLVLNTTRQAIEDRLGVAFAVGEFAPFGLARSERPAHYTLMWKSVRETSSIGGFAYVFGPDQPNPRAPNPYDSLRLLVSEFSLVDNEGNPIDGSLNALGTQWRQSPDTLVPAKSPGTAY
ncbi:MAG: hypothetical protein HY327_01065 [Chloroflexi bacterium]|nr:hypothetical protein [Chloroflexota bacterium]